MRPQYQIRRHLRRLFDPSSRKGKWTTEDRQNLLDACSRYPGDFRAVAELVGRSREDCSACLVYLNMAHSRKSDWSEGEVRRLEKAVRKVGHKWYKVSERVKTKSPIQCRNKW